MGFDSNTGVTSGVGRGVREDKDDGIGDVSGLTLGMWVEFEFTEPGARKSSSGSCLTALYEDELCVMCEFDIHPKLKFIGSCLTVYVSRVEECGLWRAEVVGAEGMFKG